MEQIAQTLIREDSAELRREQLAAYKDLMRGWEEENPIMRGLARKRIDSIEEDLLGLER